MWRRPPTTWMLRRACTPRLMVLIAYRVLRLRKPSVRDCGALGEAGGRWNCRRFGFAARSLVATRDKARRRRSNVRRGAAATTAGLRPRRRAPAESRRCSDPPRRRARQSSIVRCTTCIAKKSFPWVLRGNRRGRLHAATRVVVAMRRETLMRPSRHLDLRQLFAVGIVDMHRAGDARVEGMDGALDLQRLGRDRQTMPVGERGFVGAGLA